MIIPATPIPNDSHVVQFGIPIEDLGWRTSNHWLVKHLPQHLIVAHPFLYTKAIWGDIPTILDRPIFEVHIS